MFIPAILPGVEEPRQLTAVRINSGEIRPLVAIAPQSGERQIVSRAQTAVLPGDNVVDGKGSHMDRLRHMTVFAAFTGTLTNFDQEIPVHSFRPLRGRLLLEGTPGLGVPQGEEVCDVVEVFELFLLVGRQGAVLGFG